jgi:hypothetical protein
VGASYLPISAKLTWNTTVLAIMCEFWASVSAVILSLAGAPPQDLHA